MDAFPACADADGQTNTGASFSFSHDSMKSSCVAIQLAGLRQLARNGEDRSRCFRGLERRMQVRSGKPP